MKAKKKSSRTKRKSAKRPASARRKSPRKVRGRAPRRAASGNATKRKPAVVKRKLTRRASVIRKARVQMPSILFEGDHPTPARLSGPGEKFAQVDSSPAQVSVTESGELPEAYGTRRLFVTTRDPHWLYAHWDFTGEQQRRFNAQSAHGHLILRTYVGAAQGKPVSEIHVHPESRHWFTHVERAATEYAVELGYYRRDHQWTRVAATSSAVTPPDTISSDTAVFFATIPVDTPFEKLLARVKQAAQKNVPLAQALAEIRRCSHAEMPGSAMESAPWTPAEEQALAEVIRTDTSPCAWMDSLAISEMMLGWEYPEGSVSSLEAAGLGLLDWPAGAQESISSPSGGPPAERGFWFSVNAELVIYGATERDATVTIGGRKIVLRPDGSFSYRYSLPDGDYALAVMAVSAEGTDGRAAELRFSRTTELVGDVQTYPQDPALQPPASQEVH